MGHIILYNKTIISEKIAKLFLDHVFWYHGFFEDITPYRGPQFTSSFGKTI
jgi:hypothetical protein